MHSLQWRSLVFAALLTLLTGCGGGDGGSSPPAKQDPTDGKTLAIADACNALQWQTAGTAEPLHHVQIGSLQGSILTAVQENPRALYAEVIGEDGSAITALPVTATGNGDQMELHLVTPAHPITPFEGGQVGLRLVVDEERCPQRQLSVAPLPDPADPKQTLADTAQQLEALVVRQASTFGYYDIGSLRREADAFVQRADHIATTGELGVPAQMIPLLLAVDGIDTLNALNDSDGLSAEDRRLLAALLEAIGQNGFAAEAEALVQKLSEVSPWDPSTSTGNAVVSAATAAVAPYRMDLNADLETTILAGSGACAQAIAGNSIQIDSAGALDYYMREQKVAETAMEPTASLQGFALGAVEGALPVAGLFSGGAATAAGALIYVHKLIQQFTINTLPSSFTKLEPTVLPGTLINEDFPGTTKWQELMATASSRGMDLSGPTIEGIQQMLGAVGWARSANAGGNLASDTIEFGVDELEGAARDAVWDVWGTLQQLMEADGCFKLAAQDYGPIDITSREFSTVEVEDGTAITLSPGPLNKTGINMEHTGAAGLLLETREDRFGGRSDSWAGRIEVRAIQLEPEPLVLNVDTLGAVEWFEVYPRFSDQPDAEPLEVAILSGGGGVDTPPSIDGDRYRFSYRTPADEADYPVNLEVSRLAPLPKGSPGGSLIRKARIEITTEPGLVVSPESACIKPGDSRLLTAQVQGRSTADFDWTMISGEGSLNGAAPGNDPTVENNTYNAPASPTTAEIRVALNGADVSRTIRISVGNCDAKVALDGEFGSDAEAGGDDNSFSSDPLPNLPLLPQRPPESQYWLDRTETFNPGPQQASTTYYFYNSSNCDTASSSNSCNTENVTSTEPLDSHTSATGEIAVDRAGVLSFNLDYSGDLSCITDPNDPADPNDDTKICSESSAGAGFGSKFYIELEEPGSYELHVNFSCTEAQQAVGATGFTMTMVRFPAGSTELEDAIVPNGDPSGQTDGAFSPAGYPFYSGFHMSANACGQGSVGFTKVYELAGPVVPGTTDLIAVTLMWGAAAQPVKNFNTDTWRDYLNAGLPTIKGPMWDFRDLEPVVGDYAGQVIINGEAYFRAVD